MLIFKVNQLKGLPKLACIYSIEYIDGRKYIGHTTNLKNRMDKHFKQLNKNIHHNKYLQNVYNKYNSNNFTINVLEEIFNLDLLVIKEQYWIDFYQTYNRDNGFNFGECADNPFRGQQHSEETKEFLRKLQTGRKWAEDDYRREETSKRFKGVSRTKEDKEKISVGARLGHNDEKKEIEVVSPNGELIKIFGIRGFCRENKLHRPNFTKMTLGKIPHYKGWRLYDGKNLEPMIITKKQSYNPELTSARIRAARLGKSTSKKWSKVYFITNDGEIWETNNVSKLAREKGVERCKLANLLNGQSIELCGIRLLKIDLI